MYHATLLVLIVLAGLGIGMPCLAQERSVWDDLNAMEPAPTPQIDYARLHAILDQGDRDAEYQREAIRDRNWRILESVRETDRRLERYHDQKMLRDAGQAIRDMRE